jgi:histidinol dehydrogenase
VYNKSALKYILDLHMLNIKQVQYPESTTNSNNTSHFLKNLDAFLHLEESIDSKINQSVSDIISQIKQNKDQALIDYTNQFDGLAVSDISQLSITEDELKNAFDQLEPHIKKALETSYNRILDFHKRQKAISGESWEFEDYLGNRLGQRINAIERVGIYVPGGRAAYPSSVLMNAIPAKVAGVQHITMVVPTPQGIKNQLVLAAAYLVGVDCVYTIGGAQAIAALAYGTQTIQAVDKIVGPGNAYVAQAKRQVFGRVGIDMIAGPSEILVIADGSVNAEWVALDLFAQAEHDELAQSILISLDESYTQEVLQAMNHLLSQMPRQDIIAKSLNHRGLIIQVQNIEQACEVANHIAAEHLELAVSQPQNYFPKIKHAGAIFMGAYSSESLGDYCAGPNHVLPTAGSARFSSGLGVYDFQKRTSIIAMNQEGATILGKTAQTIAKEEGLEAHAQSAAVRINPSF